MSFPTLGLRFDLTEMTAGQAALKQTRDLYVEIAEAKAKAEGKSAGGAASAAQAEVAATQATIAALEKKMAVMEASFAEYRKLSQAAVAAETAVAAAQQKTVAAIEAKGAAFETMSARMAAGIERAAKYEDAARAQRVAAEAEAQAKIKAIISDAQAFALETNRATTASMIALARQREAAEIESQERINAVIAAANKFALETSRAQTASMVALARQREDALAAASTAAYARAEQEARRTNTPFSVISTGKTVDPSGDFLRQIQVMDQAGKKFSEYEATLKRVQAAELGVAAEAGPLISAMTKVESTIAHTGGTAFKVREAFVLMREGLRGDFTRMVGSLSLMAQAFGLLSLAVLQALAGIVLLAAPFIALAAVINKAQQELANFNNAMKATGGYAGITFDQMVESSKKLAEATDNTTSAVMKTMQAVIASGKVSGQAVAETTEAATRLAALTGQKAEQVAKSLIGMYGDAASGAEKLNDSVHFLTLAQYAEIKAMQESGDSAGAFSLAIHDLAKHLQQEGTPEMGFFEQAIHNVHTAFDKLIEKTKEWGRTATPAMRVANDMANINALQNSGMFDPSKPANQEKLNGYYTQLQHDQDSLNDAESAAKAQSYKDRVQAQGQHSLDEMQASDRKIKGNASEIQRALDDYRTQVASVLAADPTNADALYNQAHMSERLAALRKRLSPHTSGRGSTNGIRNTLGRESGEILGLQDEIANNTADPITEMLAKIRAAGAKAEGGYQFGKKADFQSQAATLAMDKERLTLINQIDAALVRQQRTEQQGLEVDKMAAATALEKAKAEQAYYASGTGSTAGDLQLQQRLVDIQEQATEKQNEYNIAQSAGVDTVGEMRGALEKLGGKTDEQISKTVADAQAALTAANAHSQAKSEIEKQTVVQDALTRAEQRYDSMKRDLAAKTQYGGDSAARQASAYIEVEAEKLITEYLEKGVVLTDEQARNMARQNGILDAQIEKWAQIKASIQDAFERTFVDTGKLDFKGLKDGFTKALRQAIYDSLIRRPIDIIINAEVNLINQLTSAFMQPLVNRLTNGLANVLGGVTGSGSSLGYSAASRSAMDAQVDAATGVKSAASMMSRATTQLGSVLRFATTALVGGQIGSSLGGSLDKALGINQGAGSKAGSIIGAIGGAAVGGFIGAIVGSFLGKVVGGLFDNKPSNNAAIGTLTQSSFTLIPNSKTTDQTAKMAQAFAQAVIASEQLLKEAGITTKGYISGIDIGTRDVPMVKFSDGHQQRLGQVGDPASAADAAMKELLKGATYVSDAEKKLVDSMLAAGSSFDDIAKKLQEFAQAADFLKAIDRDLLKAKDPQAGALADLRDQQIARRKQAITYFQDGVITADQMTALNDKLKELERIEIVQALQQFQGGLDDVTATLQEFQDAQKKIIDYADGLLIGSNSALGPQDQLLAAQSQFYALLSKAQTGDKGALDKITGAAGTYVDQGHSFYGSTPGFVSIFNAVEASLRSLGAQTYPTQDNSNAVSPDSQAVVAAVAALQAEITKSNADLITAIAPATNDNATSADIAGQTAALVGSLQGVQQTIAASTEAIVGAVGGNSTQVPLSLDQLMVGGAVF